MKTLKTTFAIALIALCSCSARPDPALETQRKLDEAAAKVAHIESYKVDMRMETPMMDQTIITNGEMAFQKPDKMRISTTTEMLDGMAMKQEIIMSGDITWTYMPTIQKVTVMDMKKFKTAGKKPAGNPANSDITTPFAGISKDRIKYIEEKETADGAVYVFETKPGFGMTPTHNSTSFQALPYPLIVWISAETGLPAKIIVKAQGGAPLLEQSFSNYRINIEIDESEFEFTPPEGVPITDLAENAMDAMRQMGGSHYQ